MKPIYLADGSTEESLFSEDNFASRRTTGHNLYDPESLLSGAEIAVGLGYDNPRVWPNYSTYVEACEGYLTAEEILTLAPRCFNLPGEKVFQFSQKAISGPGISRLRDWLDTELADIA